MSRAISMSWASLLVLLAVFAAASAQEALEVELSGAIPATKGAKKHDKHDKTCAGAITSVYCKERSDGVLTDIAYLNDKTGIQFPGCTAATNWLEDSRTKTMWLANEESIVSVTTCKGRFGISSATFATDKGQTLICGTGGDRCVTSTSPILASRKVAPLAQFRVECKKKEGRVLAIKDFCWDKNYNATVFPPDAIKVVLSVEIGGEATCPRTPAEVAEFDLSLTFISDNMREASNGVIGYIWWDRYRCTQDQFGNTTVTVPSAFVPGEGYTQEDVNNYLRSTGVNDLCDITLPSNNKGVCEDTEFFSIPFYLPPQVRNDVKARAAAIPRRAAIAARRAATTPARRGWYN